MILAPFLKARVDAFLLPVLHKYHVSFFLATTARRPHLLQSEDLAGIYIFEYNIFEVVLLFVKLPVA
jgi:hypothetical protein